MATCNYCDARIMWARTAAGSSMPLDLPPNPNGNVFMQPDPKDGRKKVAVVASAEHPRPDRGPFYTAHFGHCEAYGAKKKLEARFK